MFLWINFFYCIFFDKHILQNVCEKSFICAPGALGRGAKLVQSHLLVKK